MFGTGLNSNKSTECKCFQKTKSTVDYSDHFSVSGGSAESPVSDTGYISYESGDNTGPFSESHLALFSVREALAIPLPKVLAPGDVSLSYWSKEYPSGDLPGHLDPRQCIPHIEDTRRLLSEQPSQYRAGMRSAVVCIQG